MIAKINSVSTKKYLPVVVTSAIGYTKFEHVLGNLESPLYHRAYAQVPTQNCPVASSSLRANRFDSKKTKFVSQNVRHIRPLISTVLVTMFPYRKSP